MERRTHETHGLSLGPATFQKFHAKGYGIQTYKGAQNPSSTKIMCASAMQMAEDPLASKTYTMDTPVGKEQKQLLL